jgi:two-component system cell cycle sensor histidine kinase/response regulator CckA
VTNSPISAEQFQAYLDACPNAVAHLDDSGHVRLHNSGFAQLTGDIPASQNNPGFAQLFTEEHRASVNDMMAQARDGLKCLGPLDVSFNIQPARSALLNLTWLRSEEGAAYLLAHLQDTTEQKNLELRFSHSQKMQAVGQLAGGVAHDFNNLLTAMIGFCDLLLMRHPAGDQSFADIMQIKQNANRAANLVRQLLAFSRRQTLQPKLLDLTDVLAELTHLLRRLLGENVELKVIHGREIGMVKADQGQLEQVLINLAVNARDAMSGGGTLKVQTRLVTINAVNPLPADMVAPTDEDVIPYGEYVQVDMTDTGTGIERGMIQKIFEPFFSTKEIGSGTGLGLATVYGIVKQTGGFVYVQSTMGAGTTFSLFFPRQSEDVVKAAVSAAAEEQAKADDLTGTCTILLVEDETPVRTFAARALRNKGYTVIEADCAETALDEVEQHGDEIQLILSDVIMPGMNGPDMVGEILKTHPNLRVIFMSGYAEDVLNEYGASRNFHFLPKPFTLKQLAAKVKEVAEGK